MRKRTPKPLVIAAMLLVVTLGACGGGGMSPEPSSPSASTGTAP